MVQLQKQLASSTSQSPLFQIPAELRRRIYGYALRERIPIVMGADGSVCESSLESISDFSEQNFNQRSILRTCKMIHAESLPILYQTNTFMTDHAMDLQQFRRKTSQARLKLSNVHYFLFENPQLLTRTRIVELRRMNNLKKVIFRQAWLSSTFGFRITLPGPSASIYGSVPGTVVDDWMETWVASTVWSDELAQLLTARPHLKCDIVMQGDTIYTDPVSGNRMPHNAGTPQHVWAYFAVSYSVQTKKYMLYLRKKEIYNTHDLPDDYDNLQERIEDFD